MGDSDIDIISPKVEVPSFFESFISAPKTPIISNESLFMFFVRSSVLCHDIPPSRVVNNLFPPKYTFLLEY